MSKKIRVILIITIVSFASIILLASNVFLYSEDEPLNITNPYTQEYIIGKSNIKGEVDVEKYSNISKDLEIGANKEGYAVFKDPHKAFKYVKENYKIGIRLIKKQFYLGDLSNKNYKEYKTYGSQVTYDISEGQMYQAFFISDFLDIYENSFN